MSDDVQVSGDDISHRHAVARDRLNVDATPRSISCPSTAGSTAVDAHCGLEIRRRVEALRKDAVGGGRSELTVVGVDGDRALFLNDAHDLIEARGPGP